ncbi:Cellulose-growth-specific protein [Leucoagaricus sp. SymC.cos]|nr:Cellulose-growth-specific protein [Leucoagaricus sp. SymC.cos]
MMKSSALFIPLLAAASAYAHGYVATLTVAGKAYKGDVPGGAKDPSVIRQVSDVSPVKGATNPDINCGLNASPAQNVADANPGDQLTFDWRGGDNSNWPHNTGPMVTYLAPCGDQTCDQFDSTKAKWFKIQQVGKVNGKWAQADLMAGGVATVTLPSNLAPGGYIARHEIIALHNAVSKGGAEFYPSCSQLNVGGSGTGKPKDNELVSLPGAYSDTDPGILVPDVYNDANLDYQFPGPPVASFVGDSGSGSSSGSGSGASSTNGGHSSATSKGSKPTPTSDNSSSGSSPSKCKLKKTAQPTASADASNSNSRRSLGDDSTSTGRSLNVKYYPKHISRVMRDLAFGKSH